MRENKPAAKRNIRDLAVEVLICLHMPVILMGVVPAVYLMYTDREDTLVPVLFAGGIILLIPAVFSRIGERVFSGIAANLLLDAALIAATWRLAAWIGRKYFPGGLSAGYQVGMIILSIACVQGSFQKRLRDHAMAQARLTHDLDWKKPRYFLESPRRLFLLWFIILYLLGILFYCPQMCNAALGCTAIYLVIAFAYERIANTEDFLQELHTVSHIPVQRLRRVGNAAAALLTSVCLLGLVPAVLSRGFRRFTDLRGLQTQMPLQMLEYTWRSKTTKQEVDLLKEIAMMDVKPRPTPAWLNPLAYVLAGIMFLFMLRALVRQFRNMAVSFRSGYGENGDIIRSLASERETEHEKLSGSPFRRRSPEDKVRREYRRLVEKRLPGGPAASDTPAQIEQRAGLEDPDLHERYEQARYGRKEQKEIKQKV